MLKSKVLGSASFGHRAIWSGPPGVGFSIQSPFLGISVPQAFRGGMTEGIRATWTCANQLGILTVGRGWPGEESPEASSARPLLRKLLIPGLEEKKKVIRALKTSSNPASPQEISKLGPLNPQSEAQKAGGEQGSRLHPEQPRLRINEYTITMM